MWVGYGIECKTHNEWPYLVMRYSTPDDKINIKNGCILGKFDMIGNAELFLKALEKA